MIRNSEALSLAVLEVSLILVKIVWVAVSSRKLKISCVEGLAVWNCSCGEKISGFVSDLEDRVAASIVLVGGL